MAGNYTPGPTEERHVMTMPGGAGAEVNKYRILQQEHGTYAAFIQATSGVQYPVGVSGDCSENPANSDAVNAYQTGEPIAIKIYGVVYIEMAGSGYRHNRVMSDSVGRGTKHVDTDDVYIIGNAMKNWIEGEIIPVLIDRYYVGNVTASTGGN